MTGPMRLAIADPPYPPFVGSGGIKERASRCALPRHRDFIGQKPSAWTRWVLEALGYAPGDEVVDIFPGSGAVTDAITHHQNALVLTEPRPA